MWIISPRILKVGVLMSAPSPCLYALHRWRHGIREKKKKSDERRRSQSVVAQKTTESTSRVRHCCVVKWIDDTGARNAQQEQQHIWRICSEFLISEFPSPHYYQSSNKVASIRTGATRYLTSRVLRNKHRRCWHPVNYSVPHGTAVRLS